MGSRDRRIVLLGKTGVGKSSAGNTIFGEEVFQTESSSNTTTQRCQGETRTIDGRKITLIDPPGFFDTDNPESRWRPEILRSIEVCAPGPHAFIIVLEVGRYTKQEKEVIEKIEEYFSPNVFNYATVLFTYGDELDEEKSIEEFVAESDDLIALLKRCGDRYHVIDNEFWNDHEDPYRDNRFHAGQLMATIDKMVVSRKPNYYTL